MTSEPTTIIHPLPLLRIRARPRAILRRDPDRPRLASEGPSACIGIVPAELEERASKPPHAGDLIGRAGFPGAVHEVFSKRDSWLL